MEKIKKAMGTAHGGAHAIGGNVIDKISALIISAFGLVAALAWNTAIQGVISLFLKTSSAVEGAVTYAVIVTVIAVVVTIYMGKVTSRIIGKTE